MLVCPFALYFKIPQITVYDINILELHPAGFLKILDREKTKRSARDSNSHSSAAYVSNAFTNA